MESASADDVRARGSPKGLVLAPLQAQAQHYPKGEGWKRSQFGSRKRSQTDRQTDAPTDNDHFNRVWTSTTLLRNKFDLLLCLPLLCSQVLIPMALEGTAKGMNIAAQALAKIGITTDPRLAFPGQRVRATNCFPSVSQVAVQLSLNQPVVSP